MFSTCTIDMGAASALPSDGQRLGPKHEKTLAAAEQLGVVLQQLGRPDEAEPPQLRARRSKSLVGVAPPLSFSSKSFLFLFL